MKNNDEKTSNGPQTQHRKLKMIPTKIGSELNRCHANIMFNYHES